MKRIDSSMRDIKAVMAVHAAELCAKTERTAVVCGLLRCDADEARALLSRGRRVIRREAITTSRAVGSLKGRVA
ncbi:MAG: hypothetical protein JWL86_806 [Rhizobium sp.]|nr:hypothetical protein [Rhizobium sp.]